MCMKKGWYSAAFKRVIITVKEKEDLNSCVPIISGVAKIIEHGLSTRLTEYLAECEAFSGSTSTEEWGLDVAC